jgi:hypothetical protein
MASSSKTKGRGPGSRERLVASPVGLVLLLRAFCVRAFCCYGSKRRGIASTKDGRSIGHGPSGVVPASVGAAPEGAGQVDAVLAAVAAGAAGVGAGLGLTGAGL